MDNFASINISSSKEKFIKAYTRFLAESGDKKYSDCAAAEAEAIRVAELIDCDEYMGAAESEYCQLCANDADVKEASCVAKTDVAKDADDNTVILPIAVPCCKRCRRNHLIVQYLPTVISVVLIAIALIITNIHPVRDSLFNAKLFVPPTMRPFFIFAVVTAVAVILSSALKKYLKQRYSAQTVFDPLKIKRMSFLSEGEWERLYKNRQFNMMFDKEMPDYLTEDRHCECSECCEEHAPEQTCDCCDDEKAPYTPDGEKQDAPPDDE